MRSQKNRKATEQNLGSMQQILAICVHQKRHNL